MEIKLLRVNKNVFIPTVEDQMFVGPPHFFPPALHLTKLKSLVVFLGPVFRL